MKFQTLLLLFTHYLTQVYSQSSGCPLDWKSYRGSCYKFINYPEQSFEDARKICINYRAALVSVNDQEENSFLVAELSNSENTASSQWYTSGSQEIWQGDGKPITLTDNLYWHGGYSQPQRTDYEVIVYRRFRGPNLQGALFRFTRTSRKVKLPFICEIPQIEKDLMFQSDRDYSVGQGKGLKETDVETAPRMITSPNDTLVIGTPQQIFLECIANGNPKVTYKWFASSTKATIFDPRKTVQIVNADSGIMKRYTLINGRLAISNPKANEDSRYYQCRAENKHGVLLGRRVLLSFGSLGEFSNVPIAQANAAADKGVLISCPKIVHHGGSLRYQWSKGSGFNFVRPESNKHIFISSNGGLYFSRVQLDDAGVYYCIVKLDSDQATGYLGSQMVVSRTSQPLTLAVRSSDGGIQKPEIQDGFIAVFPTVPKVGGKLRLECFAYGTTLVYTWRRLTPQNVSIPMPENHKFSDHNRILEFPAVKIEDGGIYECSVLSQESKSADTRRKTLTIESPPVFTIPLTNQFVDLNLPQLTWRCLASGIPQPQYTWIHNGKQIANNRADDSIEVNNHVLTIKKVAMAHSGVYQCAAENSYGITFSSAELRVLQFAPYIDKQVVPGRFIGAVGGIVKMQCPAEAAPFPRFDWKKNGGDIANSAQSCNPDDRVCVRRDGTLVLRDLQSSDRGEYECVASNLLGDAKINTRLEVLSATSIIMPPRDVQSGVMVNASVSLTCEASHDPKLDMIYQWYFNDVIIDFHNHGHYKESDDGEATTLNIEQIKLRHHGKYTCVAKTQSDSVNASAIVNVNGPPSPPAGVYGVQTAMSARQTILKWMDGKPNGQPITAYIVEGCTNYDNFRDWQPLQSEAEEQSEEDRRRRKTVRKLQNLNPDTAYKFRVKAVNRHGTSEPSQPTIEYRTLSAKPTKAPTDIAGGTGKVGVLTITWTPLTEAEHHGRGFGYIVYWKKTALGEQATFQMAKLTGNVKRHVELVGLKNSYQEYDVKVCGYNDLGPGPNSTAKVVRAAANMPQGIPKDPYGEGFNATALRIYWVKVEDTFEQIRGKLIGYKINYWITGEDEASARQAILPGQAESGLLIGLEPSTMYSFNIQVYNSAGNGPKSEIYQQSTFNKRPQHYPTEVYVHTIPEKPGSVRVTWRGVSTTTGEEPLQGYMVRYWVYGTDIRNATTKAVGRVNTASFDGIKKNVRYQLRVLGYSRGGDGKMSMPALTFIMYNSEIIIDSSITEIRGKTSTVTTSMCLVMLSSILSYLS